MAIIVRKPWLPVVQRRHPLTRGMIAAWLFHVGIGTKLRDTIGGLDADTVGSPPWAVSPFGTGITFDGSSQSATIVSNIAPSLVPPSLGLIANTVVSGGTAGSDYSIAAIVKTTSAAAIGATAGWSCGNCIIEARNTTGDVTSHAWSFGTEGGKLSTSRIAETSSTTDALRISSLADVNDDKYHLLLATVSLNAVSLYIDRTLDSTGTFATFANGDCSVGGGTPNVYMQIGARTTNAGATASWFSGDIDSVIMWNRALTGSEAQLLYDDYYAPFRQNSRLVWEVDAGTTSPVFTTGMIFGSA